MLSACQFCRRSPAALPGLLHGRALGRGRERVRNGSAAGRAERAKSSVAWRGPGREGGCGSRFFLHSSLAKRARRSLNRLRVSILADGEALTDLGEVLHFRAGGCGRRATIKRRAWCRSCRRSIPRARMFCMARIAESTKDYGTAEREFKLATTDQRPSCIPVDDAGQLLPQAGALERYAERG